MHRDRPLRATAVSRPGWRGALPFGAAALAAVVLAVLSASAAPAATVGFGAPRALPGGAHAEAPVTAVAASGRTVVLARSATGSGAGRQVAEQAWLGPDPDPDHLAGPVVVPGLADGPEVRATAEPDGTIVACTTPDPPDPRRDPYVFLCALAPPGGGFGPAQTVASLASTPAAQRVGRPPSYEVIALADGRLALLAGHSETGRDTQITLALAPADSLAFGPPALVPGRSGGFTALPDGGLLDAYTTADEVDGRRGRGFTRTLAPGASVFAPAVAFTPPGAVSGGVQVEAGRYGTALTTSKERKNAYEQQLVSVRKPGGGWAAPVRMRAVTDGFVFGRVLFGPDRRPLVITSVSHESQTDCSQQTLGRVGTGPLTGARPMLLSNKHQIANLLDARVLDDGTVVVLWVDSATAARIEYAVRQAHAHHFSRPHALPFTVARDISTAGNGHHIITAWTSGSSSRLIISTSRTSPPYTPSAPLPTHPSAPCG